MNSTRTARPRGIVIVSAGGLRFGGGIGSVTRLIAARIPSLSPGIRVDVLDARGERRGGALWSLVLAPWALLRLCFLRAWHRPEVLHLQVSERISFPRKGLFLWAGKALGMGVVVHHHGAEFIETYASATPRMRAIMRGVVHKADVNIVLGQRWRDFLVDDLGVDASRVALFYNTANDLSSASLPARHDLWKFLITANLIPRKGISELLQAVKLLADGGAPVSLTLAGGGQVERYRAEAESLGLASRCTFTGWIQGPALHELIRTHSALVLPSHFEGLPISILEALGARLPVVTTPVGSIPEVLRDGENCLFVEVGDVHAIAAAMSRLATDGVLRATLENRGRELYEKHFLAGPYMERLLALYRGLALGQRPGAPAKATESAPLH